MAGESRSDRPGLQAERTSLSWERMALALLANGTLLLLRDQRGISWADAGQRVRARSCGGVCGARVPPGPPHPVRPPGGRAAHECASLVDTPLSLTLTDLRDRFDPRDTVATLQCAGNRRLGSRHSRRGTVGTLRDLDRPLDRNLPRRRPRRRRRDRPRSPRGVRCGRPVGGSEPTPDCLAAGRRRRGDRMPVETYHAGVILEMP
jgi:hypothetical protein